MQAHPLVTKINLMTEKPIFRLCGESTPESKALSKKIIGGTSPIAGKSLSLSTAVDSRFEKKVKLVPDVRQLDNAKPDNEGGKSYSYKLPQDVKERIEQETLKGAQLRI